MSIILALALPDSTKLLYTLITVLVGGTVTIVILIIKNWCKLLAGTYAVVHRDEQRRADARLVYERAVDGERDDPPQIEGPPQSPDGRPPPRWRRRKREQRR